MKPWEWSLYAWSLDAWSLDAWGLDAWSLDAYSLYVWSHDVWSLNAWSLGAYNLDAGSIVVWSLVHGALMQGALMHVSLIHRAYMHEALIHIRIVVLNRSYLPNAQPIWNNYIPQEPENLRFAQVIICFCIKKYITDVSVCITWPVYCTAIGGSFGDVIRNIQTIRNNFINYIYWKCKIKI